MWRLLMGLFASSCVTTSAVAPLPQWVEGPAGRLRVEVQGSGTGTPVVFVHGLGGQITTWADAMAHLSGHRRVVAFDARGHGQSARAMVNSIETWADDLLAVVQACGLTRFVLVGHSMAGLVLQRFANDHPAMVAGLVYVDAIGDFRRAGTPDQLAAFAENEARPTTLAQRREAFSDLLGSLARDSTRANVLNALEALDANAWSQLRASMATTVPPGGATTVSTLAIEATGNDAPVRFSALGQPGVTLVEIPNASHWLMLDSPQAFAAALESFLAQLPP
jgi:pimeloyl-ACP methyl ester carboxylesterase